MKILELLSWNVNGIRALSKKTIYKDDNFLSWLEKNSPDILCLQETKAHPEQVTEEMINPPGYHSNWSSAERKGYSGVVTYSKEKPTTVEHKIGVERLDKEGRIVTIEHSNIVVCNVYFPNGKKDNERLKYKMDFYDAFLDFTEKKRAEGKSVVFCGDVNTAHKPIDLSRPKSNEKISGFLPIEREWLDKIVDMGYIDSFRFIHKDKPEQYSWWSVRTNARERNIGWRLDYFFVTADLKDRIVDAYILPEITGSDHCPVGLKLKI